MAGTELEREYAVSKIVPIDDDLAAAYSGDKPDEKECRYTRRILRELKNGDIAVKDEGIPGQV